MWLRARGTREFCICLAPKLQGLHLTQHMVVLSILQSSSLFKCSLNSEPGDAWVPPSY